MAQIKTVSDIKAAVVGYGPGWNMGEKHLTAMQSLGIVPTAVCELNPARLEIARKDFPGIETYQSVTEMLRKSAANLVVIITPHNTHRKLAVQCMNAGRHIICEKPMAISTRDCDAMIASAKKNRVMLTVNHNRHWDGCILHALKTVKAGTIGEIVSLDAHMSWYIKPDDSWLSSKTMSGGLLYPSGAHLLEMALQLIDSPIVEVTGFSSEGIWADKTRWKDDTIEDSAWLCVRFKSGQSLRLSMSSIDTTPARGIMDIQGTKGTLVMDNDLTQDWRILKPRGKQIVERSGPNPKSRWKNLHRNVIAHLTKREKLVITPLLGRRVVQILELGAKSAKLGRAVSVTR